MSKNKRLRCFYSYAKEGLAAGEPLHGDSAVIAPDHKYKIDRGSNGNKTFLPT